MRTGELGAPRTRSGLSRRSTAGAASDLRTTLRLERRLVPALAMVALLGAHGAGLTQTAVLAWLGAVVVGLVLRYVLALQHGDAGVALRPDELPWRLYVASYFVDLLLWAALLLALAAPAAVAAGAVGLAAGGAVVLAALTLARLPRAWLLYVLGWLAIGIAATIRAGGVEAGQPFSIGFPLWLAAIWALGRAQGRHGRSHSGSPQTWSSLESRTRFGWFSAVQAMPAPVVVVRLGRIVDANEAALQFIGRSEEQVIGSSVNDCLKTEPPDAFDARFAQPMPRTVLVRPAHRTFEDSIAWSARVRVLHPGEADSAIVALLARPTLAAQPAADSFAEEARRVIDWLGAAPPGATPWCRDERGRVLLSDEFAPLPPLVGMTFPLAPWVVEAERAAVEADYRRAVQTGQVFARDLTLLDKDGALRKRHVTALTRAVEGREAFNAPVVGRLTDVRASAAAPAGAEPAPEVLRHLPVLVWAIDGQGRVLRTYGADPWRWGMKADAQDEPQWSAAFDLPLNDKAALLTGLRAALVGKPSFDILNARTTRTGGRIVLRSHVVPYKHEGRGAGALVLDTIASPRQISEIDRLRRSKQHYKALVEASTSLIWSCDAHFNFTFVSRRAAREIYGYEAQDLVGRSLNSLLSPQVDQSAAQRALVRLRLGEPIKQFEMVQQARDGQRVVVAVDAAPLFGSDRVFMGAVGVNSDLTMLKQRERRLTEALRIERTVLDSAGQAIAVVKDGLAVRCNAAFLKLLATQPALLARTPVADFFAAAGDWEEIAQAAEAARAADRATSREVQIVRGGRAVSLGSAWCQLTARSITPGEYVLVLADIDHIRSREAEALHHAHHDELTGLPNRRLLAMRGGAALAASDLRNGRCAVLVIDLDGFKNINDAYGHKVGDAVLREIAQRLTRLLRPQDTVARRGGDEFVMLVPDVGERADVERIAVRLLQAVSQPVALPTGEQGQVSASVGVALSPEHGRDLERLLQLADHAMYDAKQKGKNRYALVARAAAGGSVTPLAPRAARAT